MKDFAQIWPGWEVVRKLGSGSFGAVYEIQRTIRGRTEHAAVKVLTIPQSKSEVAELRADGYDDESITQYFADSLDKIEGEYAMMADMKGHSNVVYCDDLRTEAHEDGFGWDIYIKMELLSPLKSVLREDAPQEQAVKLGIDMCGALELCEKMKIVHRDIKPENIFVSRDGTFKLGDFGIARTMEGTTGGTKTGTYDYMAPEVYNNRPYHTQADIYSLGLVLYWILNERTVPFLPIGTRPTPSVKSAARERRFSGEAIPAPANGSEALKAIVLKACAFDPKDRYQTAAEMREDLKKLDTGAVFVPPVVVATPAEPVPSGEGTVSIFPGKRETAPEEGTVNIFGSNTAEEKTEYIQDEKTEYIRDEKTEYIPRSAPAEEEKPKEKKKNWWIPVVAGVLVIALLIALLRSCRQPAGPSETTGTMPGTTQTDGTTAPEDTTAPSTGETTVPSTTEGTTPPTTAPEQTLPPTTVPEQTVPPTVPSTTAPPETQPPVALTGISVATKPGKSSYTVGDKLDTAGLTVKLTYSNGSTKTVSTGFSCSPTTLNTAGEQTVTVTYEGKTATFKVTVLEILSSGSCGDNLTYVLTSDGHLEITGSGAMHNYQGFNGMPWSEYRTLVTSVSLPDGLTTIGSSAFSGHGNLTAIDIPDSVISIGQAAFHISKKLESVEIPDGVEMIGYLAFDGVAAASFVVPSKVTELSEWTFSGDNLTDVWILNPDCKLHSNASGSLAYGKTGTKVRLHGYAGSTTQAYAERLSDRYVFVEIT